MDFRRQNYGGADVKIKKQFLFICLILAMAGCGQTAENRKDSESGDISYGVLREEVFALVSSAENSTTDYAEQYGWQNHSFAVGGCPVMYGMYGKNGSGDTP